MTELELFDKLNPKRDLPQATCEVISQVYKVMNIENEQLKAQIEKMKCCGNCKYWNYKDIQKYCNKRTGTPELASRSFKCDKWELTE